ncbi:glycosyltransferase N-terminal domain-containing protein [Echinicola jeungdonensis]|uniref:glycosyltransferase N-terminal domain-containing protein n=1 Tax=Echinicola jeungdonensis TaxID=709343 RepID=UPI0025B55BD8|nr:glycosyltransferase N-terminal domain-containing protein [Echinicola jeungdonensis]MDN3669612.1 glycosyltransferase N-terminal domain-containing protein [Echinicola jeungdonensis]
MKLLYDFSVWVFSCTLQLAKNGDSKLARLVRGRDGIFEELESFCKQKSGDLVWFHVASLGEYEQAKPVIAKLKATFPNLNVVLTFFSPSGYENVIKKNSPMLTWSPICPLIPRVMPGGSWIFFNQKLLFL